MVLLAVEGHQDGCRGSSVRGEQARRHAAHNATGLVKGSMHGDGTEATRRRRIERGGVCQSSAYEAAAIVRAASRGPHASNVDDRCTRARARTRGDTVELRRAVAHKVLQTDSRAIGIVLAIGCHVQRRDPLGENTAGDAGRSARLQDDGGRDAAHRAAERCLERARQGLAAELAEAARVVAARGEIGPGDGDTGAPERRARARADRGECRRRVEDERRDRGRPPDLALGA